MNVVHLLVMLSAAAPSNESDSIKAYGLWTITLQRIFLWKLIHIYEIVSVITMMLMCCLFCWTEYWFIWLFLNLLFLKFFKYFHALSFFPQPTRPILPLWLTIGVIANKYFVEEVKNNHFDLFKGILKTITCALQENNLNRISFAHDVRYETLTNSIRVAGLLDNKTAKKV